MNTKTLAKLLQNPQNFNSKNTEELNTVINEYPYFQAARAIYLKGLKNNESFKYNAELKTTAAFTTDRTVLFDFITSTEFSEPTTPNEIKDVHQQISEKIISETPNQIKEELEIGKPISFTEKETHSFNEWLQLSSHKKIERSQKTNEVDNFAIIDNFIKSNPKISKVPKDAERYSVVTESKQDSYLMTETLAKVYLEQKKYENAIKAYEILSLKYPEKSGFFADQIKRIRIFIKK